MSKFNEIQKIISRLPASFQIDEVSLDDAFNRILQEDVFADMDMPPFHKSAMDGYACHLEDIGNILEITETIGAGKLPSKPVGKNQCAKIMTGAAVPDGCDCVFMLEDSETLDETHVKCTNPNTKKNICYLGEDYKTGDILLKKGTIINVSQMAVLAGAGYAKVKVAAQPKITLIATGSELVHPGQKPNPGQIRNSNSSQVISQLKKMNMEPVANFMLADEKEKLTTRFLKAFETSNYIIFTGGASFGEFDLIPVILKEQGFTTFWETTGMKPGNPMSFSEKDGKYVFGLSGNPVSSLVQFEMIAKPAIYKLLGADYKAFKIQAKMDFSYSRKKGNRLALEPVLINETGLISNIPFHGSAHINALTSANALLEVPVGETTINKGDLAYVRPL